MRQACCSEVMVAHQLSCQVTPYVSGSGSGALDFAHQEAPIGERWTWTLESTTNQLTQQDKQACVILSELFLDTELTHWGSTTLPPDCALLGFLSRLWSTSFVRTSSPSFHLIFSASPANGKELMRIGYFSGQKVCRRFRMDEKWIWDDIKKGLNEGSLVKR